MKSTPKRRARLAILAVLGAAIAAAAFTASSQSRSRRHAMTPAVGATPVVQNLGALGAPANQPGRLRQCQLDGTCYGPNQIRNAYGFQPLLNKGITGSGSTIVIIDAYGSNTLQQDFDTQQCVLGPAGADDPGDRTVRDCSHDARQRLRLEG